LEFSSSGGEENEEGASAWSDGGEARGDAWRIVDTPVATGAARSKCDL